MVWQRIKKEKKKEKRIEEKDMIKMMMIKINKKKK